MTTEPAAATPLALPSATLLQLMWLASPALPVGGFSYSEGLEAAVDAGRIVDEAQATAWLVDQMEFTLARGDGPALAAAQAAWAAHDAATVTAVNDWLRQTRESAEFRAQAEQMGRSLVDWLRNGPTSADGRIAQLAGLSPAPLWPVAFALAAALAGADARTALLAYGWGWAENLAQAAMKAVPLGQAAAQRMLSRLAEALPDMVDAALARAAAGPEAWQAHSPMLAVLSARHEAQYSRLFRS